MRSHNKPWFSSKPGIQDENDLLHIGITHEQGNVVIRFGKEISWVALPPPFARRIAASIAAHANAVEKPMRVLETLSQHLTCTDKEEDD